MRKMYSQLSRLILVAIAVLGPLAADAFACPLCSESLKDVPALPRAYMASILFMLAMPATLLTAFGIGFYRLSKKANSPNIDELDESVVEGNLAE